MHVNLLLESECRNASPVTIGMAIKIAIGTVVALLVLLGATLYSSHRALQNNVQYAESEWAQTEPKYKAALQLEADLKSKKLIHKEILGWRASRVEWGNQLDGLWQVAPSSIQLTDLQIAHNAVLVSNGVPARAFQMRLQGRTGAARSETNVRVFHDALSGQAPFTAQIESVVIPPGTYRQDPSSKSDMLFEIVCKYKARTFE